MHDRSAESVRALEFYSGIGGLHLALKRSKVPGIVIKAFDWDQNAARVYDANHGPSLTAKTDISDLTASFLAPYRANLWILSPACQPYTVLNPDAKGILDPRAKSFLHLVQDVLPELVSMGAHPTHFLVENVGGFEGSPTRRVLLSQLHTLGYTTAEFLLTPLQFGIPNSRLRYYLLAKTAPFSFPYIQAGETYQYIPHGNEQYDEVSSTWLDPRMNPIADSELVDVNIRDIQHYLDNEDGSSLYLGAHAVSDRVLEKWGRLFDIAIPSSKRTCCFTRGYTHLVERSGSIIQMNPELNTKKTFDTFLAAQASGQQDAVSILHPLRLRYFTPSELLRIFHFNLPSNPVGKDRETSLSTIHSTDETDEKTENAASITVNGSQNDDHNGSTFTDKFFWPESISTKTKYRLIGNSVNVHVVTELINFLYEDRL
ncbi:S-adenosyl-L-methionine-dependent methyltransferase [Lentinula edodes]|uniref:S-adenosyl-L-methionine-dependent methyltransferase n=1 Tax=Lentinula edodes TaxID=5353 RepID=UPI001E8D3730|nr:S-adenosyl-L-methionine-dependent methyltransferase [Lentinula edodes]KAH7881448.1 S-adenosyl-L-methionine-dependent methyltransferase [Lentinula edodes]